MRLAGFLLASAVIVACSSGNKGGPEDAGHADGVASDAPEDTQPAVDTGPAQDAFEYDGYIAFDAGNEDVEVPDSGSLVAGDACQTGIGALADAAPPRPCAPGLLCCPGNQKGTDG
ncbi:MAG TPA: hypothetical protein VIY73_11860, partial [Polyangiaceae bacterium]